MIKAYLAGVPGNAQPFPDGARMAKIHWNPKKLETFPATTVPGTQHDIDFMVKYSKRFTDSGGWDTPCSTMTLHPIRYARHLGWQAAAGNDAKCGFACHTSVKTRSRTGSMRPSGGLRFSEKPSDGS
jgi:hypothetical protein